MSYFHLLPKSLKITFQTLNELISPKQHHLTDSKHAKSKFQNPPAPTNSHKIQQQNLIKFPLLNLTNRDLLFYVKRCQPKLENLHSEDFSDGAEWSNFEGFVGSFDGSKSSFNRTGFAFGNRKMQGGTHSKTGLAEILDVSQWIGAGKWVDISAKGKDVFALKENQKKIELVHVRRISGPNSGNSLTPSGNFKNRESYRIDEKSSSEHAQISKNGDLVSLKRSFCSKVIKIFDFAQKLFLIDSHLIIFKNEREVETIELKNLTSAEPKFEGNNDFQKKRSGEQISHTDNSDFNEFREISSQNYQIKDRIKKISAGNEHCVILTQNQTLLGFGKNSFHELSPEISLNQSQSRVYGGKWDENLGNVDHSKERNESRLTTLHRAEKQMLKSVNDGDLLNTDSESSKIRSTDSLERKSGSQSHFNNLESNIMFNFEQLESFDYEVVDDVFCGGNLTLVKTRKGSFQMMGKLTKKLLFRYPRNVKIDFNQNDISGKIY